jgi:UDP-glucose 4-epimerase
LAGLKSISESNSDPLKYYDNNICGVVNLIKCMKYHKVNKIIFSSSASVYGNSKEIPINEKCEIELLNPYATTKFFSESILKDCVKAYGMSCVSLRYFNPVGSHSSGLLDENYESPTSNLFPLIVSIYSGYRNRLEIFGEDYDTRDGTAIRDYIYVEDLASGHLNTLNYLEKSQSPKFKIFNLGTGKGYSVLEVIKKFELYTTKKLNWNFGDRRVGDPDILIADTSKARPILKFTPCDSLDYMVLSSIRSIKTFKEEGKNDI